jgi:hypothetical protein
MNKKVVYKIKPLKKAKLSRNAMAGCSRTSENVCGIAYRQSA